MKTTAPVTTAVAVAVTIAVSAAAGPCPAFSDEPPPQPSSPVAAVAAASATSATTGSGAAPVPVAPARSLDGYYLVGGPAGASLRVGKVWQPSYGLVVGFFRLRASEALSLVGASAGALRHEGDESGRLWLGISSATRLGPTDVGVSVDGILDVGEQTHPSPGLRLAVWAYLGISPYAGLAWSEEAGTTVELGLALALPLRRW